MPEREAKTIQTDIVFAEGVRWHAGELWFSDMWDYRVWKIGKSGEPEEVVQVVNRPSGLAFLPDGTPVVVSMVDQKLFAIRDGALELYADLSRMARGEANDAIADADGRIYVGSFGYDLFGGEQAAPADLLIVQPDRTVQVAAPSLTFPNGMALVDCGRTLVVAETWANRLTAFPRNRDGTLGSGREFANLAQRTPDGICSDEEGGIWVSSFETGEVLRVLEGGEVTDWVSFPGKRAVTCMLGGDDLKTLFCSTYKGAIEDISSGERAGAIEAVRVDVPGSQLG